MTSLRNRSRSGWSRRAEDRLVGGVAGGIADQLGVDANLVRLAFVVLGFANGLGLFLYAIAWVLLPVTDGQGPIVAGQSRQLDRDVDLVRGLAVGAIVLGSALLARQVSPWLPDRLLWPAVVTAAGLAMVWRRDPDRRAGDFIGTLTNGSVRTPKDVAAFITDSWSGSGRRTVARLAIGAVLVTLGAGAFIAANGSFTALRQGLVAGAILVIGLALILGPWLLRLSTDLARERRARIRSEARSDFAAHIHDSVLQTLAIIQRRADQPREVVTLARRQERELRAWLYADTEARSGDRGASLGETLEALTDEVEADHRVRIDLVRVGDVAMDDRLAPLTMAVREAVVNAAKHAGVDDISVYLEVDGRDIAVFIRDRGTGFDPDHVAPDRRGISDSIRARMERAGGRVRITSAPGEGTEVELSITAAPKPTGQPPVTTVQPPVKPRSDTGSET